MPQVRRRRLTGRQSLGSGVEAVELVGEVRRLLLEPPQPMVRVLERLETLAPCDTLAVLHDRQPLFLDPKLEDRGFAHETDEPEAGLVRIRIRRRAP